MKLNLAMRALAGVLLTAAVMAHATAADEKATPAGSTLPAGVATYGQLDELRSQAALAQARDKLAVSKPSSLAAPMRAADMLAAPSAPASTPAPKAGAASQPPIHAEIELVASDKEGRLYAVLGLQDGRQVPARMGMAIPGLGVIKSVSINEVVVEGKQGKLTTLPFASESGSGAGVPAAAGPMPFAPGLSTVMPPIPASMRGGR